MSNNTPREIYDPRNPWTRASKAIDLAREDNLYYAMRTLENLQYSQSVPKGIFELYSNVLKDMCPTAQPLYNIPADYTSSQDPRLRQPFRKLRSNHTTPKPYPRSLALPELIGNRNDWRFIRDAATTSSCKPLRRVHLLISNVKPSELTALKRQLSEQDYNGYFTQTYFCETLPSPPASTERCQYISDNILSEKAQNYIAELVNRSGAEKDIIIFLSGDISLDKAFLKRATYLSQASNNIVQPLAPQEETDQLETYFRWGNRHIISKARYPFREILGMNMVVPISLLKKVGSLDTRFSSLSFAARELAWRMFNIGAYFAPLFTPSMAGWNDQGKYPNDKELYISLCPNSWDRKEDGIYERPRVSIYIPAYNAEKFIRQAVDSVLEQDIDDLEVCIADDGSTDNTLNILEKHYSDNRQVRFQSAKNGGIGCASNRAIRMTNAPYIGQLDSDDRLKSGAIRSLMTYLDENPNTVCVYSSCERIDPEGNFIQNEYSWPQFSREKMMVTSIAHHFRMFRRAAWERTSYFREDIANAVDYDMFLKLSETGPFHHIDEIMYQRRWHGANTSKINEGYQTENTYIAQRQALRRLGLDHCWKVDIPNPKEPRRITYNRVAGCKTVIFYPDYSRSNPYQHMLYGKARENYEFCAGTIDAALEQIDSPERPQELTFHLHWINFVLREAKSIQEARSKADEFVAKLEKFVWKGGQLVWTIHNSLSHDTEFRDIEVELSEHIARISHSLHFHSAASVYEVNQVFTVPLEKVYISQHGNYMGCYPDFISRENARHHLELSSKDDVILFTGQVRKYKGIDQLIFAFREILRSRPNSILLLAGQDYEGLVDAIVPTASSWERNRIRTANRFIDDLEMQVFLRAADFAVYPYNNILTSGSLMLALSFGLPVAIPSVGMTREVLEGQCAGALYDAAGGVTKLKEALHQLLKAKDAGKLETMSRSAYQLAEKYGWPDFSAVLQRNSSIAFLNRGVDSCADRSRL